MANVRDMTAAEIATTTTEVDGPLNQTTFGFEDGDNDEYHECTDPGCSCHTEHSIFPGGSDWKFGAERWEEEEENESTAGLCKCDCDEDNDEETFGMRETYLPNQKTAGNPKKSTGGGEEEDENKYAASDYGGDDESVYRRRMQPEEAKAQAVVGDLAALIDAKRKEHLGSLMLTLAKVDAITNNKYIPSHAALLTEMVAKEVAKTPDSLKFGTWNPLQNILDQIPGHTGKPNAVAVDRRM